MERCPNCGQPVRAGAKFCTTCGYRIAGDDLGTEAPVEATSPGSIDAPREGAPVEEEATVGWPATTPESDPGSGLEWAPRPATTATAENESEESGNENEILPGIWATDTTSNWPAPPENGSPASMPDASAVLPVAELDRGAEAETLTDDEQSIEAARERATRLLDELREAISSLGGGQPVDLSGVVADLEVAVTPPGAMNADELNALREALLAARAQPRDIDTMVALTGRLDALVALVFAYDRAVAAIERSLETLRRA